MRANPNTFCTKWLEQSNAMSDAEHVAADEIERNRKQLAWFLQRQPAVCRISRPTARPRPACVVSERHQAVQPVQELDRTTRSPNR